jgi:predicted esterase
MIARLLLALLAASTAALAQNDAETIRFKVAVAGENRKGGLLLPKGLRKNEILPLVVAIPDTEGASFKEIDQWAVFANKHRFAVVSIDCETPKGWSVSEQMLMQRDMEGVAGAVEEARRRAPIDDTAIVIHGHLGGCYLAYSMGIRRPDLFLGVAVNSCVFYPDMKPKEAELASMNLRQPILVAHGELDTPRVIKETQLMHAALKDAGFARVTFQTVPKASNVPNLETSFVPWFVKLLEETEKSRKMVRKGRDALARIKSDLEAGGKPGALKELAALAEQERASGARFGAAELLAPILAKAEATIHRAKTLEGAGSFAEAAEAFREVAERYPGLAAATEAAKERQRILKSDGYRAEAMLFEALRLEEEGQAEKAMQLFEKILAQFPATPAAEVAKRRAG